MTKNSNKVGTSLILHKNYKEKSIGNPLKHSQEPRYAISMHPIPSSPIMRRDARISHSGCVRAAAYRILRRAADI